MRNISFLRIISILLVGIIFTLAGCQSPGSTSLTYEKNQVGDITYEKNQVGDITYEVPKELTEDSLFSVIMREGFSEKLQNFYLETDIFNVLKGTLPNLKFNAKEKYGAYEVYSYVDTVVIAGEETPINVAAIGHNDCIYTFVFIWENYADKQEEIYTHFLMSLK